MSQPLGSGSPLSRGPSPAAPAGPPRRRARALVVALLAALVATVGYIVHLYYPGSGRPVVRVACHGNSRALPFLVAQREGFFEGRQVSVVLIEGEEARQAMDRIDTAVVAACPAPAAFERLSRADGEWLWFEVAAEDKDAEPLSVIYVRRDGPGSLRELEERLAKGDITMAVANEYWAEEARHLWPSHGPGGPATLDSLRPDDLARHAAPVFFGDVLDLGALEGDHRFRLLTTNVRASRGGQRYAWDSAHLVRRSFANDHSQKVQALIEALAEARTWIEKHPDEAGQLLREHFRLTPRGKKLPPLAYLSPSDDEAAAVIRRWEQAAPRPPADTVATRYWPGVQAGGALAPVPPEGGGNVPEFAAPKPKDVWADPPQ